MPASSLALGEECFLVLVQALAPAPSEYLVLLSAQHLVPVPVVQILAEPAAVGLVAWDAFGPFLALLLAEVVRALSQPPLSLSKRKLIDLVLGPMGAWALSEGFVVASTARLT